MVVGRRRQAELREDARHVLLDRAERDEEPLSDGLVRAPLGHQLEHLALTGRELLEGVVAPLAADELADDGRVEGRAAVRDPAVVSELVGRKRRDDPLEQLTAREREVLELMAEGRSNQAIAERLFVTLRAVEKHVTSIFTKLGLPASTDDHRRVLAVLTYLRA